MTWRHRIAFAVFAYGVLRNLGCPRWRAVTLVAREAVDFNIIEPGAM